MPFQNKEKYTQEEARKILKHVLTTQFPQGGRPRDVVEACCKLVGKRRKHKDGSDCAFAIQIRFARKELVEQQLMEPHMGTTRVNNCCWKLRK